MSAPGPATELLGRIAYYFSNVQPYLPTYLHLLASAIFPIYAGAHASLSPPSSAAKSSKTKADADNDDEDTSEIKYQKMEGMSPTDALMIPLMAGCTLAILYFLIKWLQDPTILNQIINWYLSFFGVLSIARLSTDVMGVVSTFLFPAVYADSGEVWTVRRERRVFQTGRAEGDFHSKPNSRSSPLPGALARLSLSPRLLNMLWTLRELPARKLHFRVHVYKSPDIQFRVGPHGFGSTLLATGAVLYFNFVDKPWWLTNLLGFSVSYSVLQLMSPTTFWTGTMILGALFIYDIYFVFFTPLMITVATKLDIPAKLLFPRPRGPDDDPDKEALSMLGLGDVVLPGIMIGLALRFDLYLFYLRQQTGCKKINNDESAKIATRIVTDEDIKDVEVDVTSEDTGSKTADNVEQNGDEILKIVKVSWRSATGRWGERFWLGRYSGNGDHQEGGAFPKPYFHAALAGYIFGMVCTLSVMQIYSHAQPALLYLVPSVLGSLWFTAFFKGDLRAMWEYTEATEEEISEKDRQGKLEKRSMKSIFSFARHEERARKTVKEGLNKAAMGDTGTEAQKTTEVKEEDAKTASLHAAKNRQLLLFSISLPQKPTNRYEEKSSTPETATKLNDDLGNTSKSEPGTDKSSDGSSPHSKMSGGEADGGDELVRKRQRIF